MPRPDLLIKDQAVITLAEQFYTEWKNSGTESIPEWVALTEQERERYRLCIESIFTKQEVLMKALGWRGAFAQRPLPGNLRDRPTRGNPNQ